MSDPLPQELEARLKRIEEHVGLLENSVAPRIEKSLKDEERQAQLDVESLEQQLASLDAAVRTLQDRLQAVETRLGR